MAAGDLVTLAQVQTAYPDLDSYELADIPSLISAVSLEISERRPRAALASDCDETHDPGVSRTIRLKRKPVLRVYRVRDTMAMVLQIKRTGDCYRANFEVLTMGEPGAQTVTGIQLGSVQGGVVVPETPILFSTYTTVSAVAAAINGLSGWSASVMPGQEQQPSTDIEPGQGPKECYLTPSGGVWAYTRDLWDWDLSDASNGVITIYTTNVQSFSFPASTWGVDPRSTRKRVLYNAGRSVVPADVQRAAILVIGDLLGATENIGPVNSERNQDYAYTLRSAQYTWPPEAVRILNRYQDRRF